MNTTEPFASCLYIGLRVEVYIPLSDTGTFRDWAIINDLDGDLLELQLSRDVLPLGITMHAGQVLSLRCEIDFEIYTCRAFVLSKDQDQNILLQLSEEIRSSEARKFHRIASFLPVRLHVLADQNPLAVAIQWEKRQMQRLAADRIRVLRHEQIRQEKQQRYEEERLQALRDGAPYLAPPPDETYPGEYQEAWGEVTASLVNISGGGIKMLTGQEFLPGERVGMQLYIPTADRIVDVVGRVVFCSRDMLATGRLFHTGIEFSLISESARSAITTYISRIQLRRIRVGKGFTDIRHSLPAPQEDSSKNAAVPANLHALSLQSTPWKQVALYLLFVLAALPLTVYLYNYLEKQPRNQIQVLVKNSIGATTQ